MKFGKNRTLESRLHSDFKSVWYYKGEQKVWLLETERLGGRPSLFCVTKSVLPQGRTRLLTMLGAFSYHSDCCEGQGSGRKQSVSPSLKCPGNTKAKRPITTLTSFLLIADKSTQKDCIKQNSVSQVQNMLRKTKAANDFVVFSYDCLQSAQCRKTSSSSYSALPEKNRHIED